MSPKTPLHIGIDAHHLDAEELLDRLANLHLIGIQDLIDEFTSGPSGPTPRFALKNIEIIDGKIDFDDRPEQTKHTISNIKIGVPFISSIPSQVDIKVQPAFSALINGSPLVVGGEIITRFLADRTQWPTYQLSRFTRDLASVGEGRSVALETVSTRYCFGTP